MAPLGLFGPLGLPELLVIFAILAFIFGARKIPELARGLGEGIRNFRTAMKSGDEERSETGSPEGSTGDSNQQDTRTGS